MTKKTAGLRCPECGKRVKNNTGLSAHMRFSHSAETKEVPQVPAPPPELRAEVQHFINLFLESSEAREILRDEVGRNLTALRERQNWLAELDAAFNPKTRTATG